MSVQLLPCPFCGTQATATHGATFFKSTDGLGWVVVCPCCSVGTGQYFDQQGAANRWNTRADTHAAEVARLRGALETAKDDMLDMLGYVTLEGNGFSTVQERDEWFASDLAKIDTALAPAARKEAK